jgi:hypothetical protein
MQATTRVIARATPPYTGSVGLNLVTDVIDPDLVSPALRSTLVPTSTGSSGVTGTVLDVCDGEPVVGIEVRVGDTVTQTDENGNYLVSDLESGTYTVTLLPDEDGGEPLQEPRTVRVDDGIEVVHWALRGPECLQPTPTPTLSPTPTASPTLSPTPTLPPTDTPTPEATTEPTPAADDTTGGEDSMDLLNLGQGYEIVAWGTLVVIAMVIIGGALRQRKR